MAERYDPYGTLAGVLPKDSFLRPEFQARDLDELLDSLLVFDDFIPKQTVDATTFSYQIETDGAGTGTRASGGPPSLPRSLQPRATCPAHTRPPRPRTAMTARGDGSFCAM